MVRFTSEKERFLVQIYKMWTVIWDLYEECPQNKPMHIPCKFKNDKTYVTWQEELKFVRKNDLNNLLSQCEILKLRKNNLLEIITNHDMISEEKLSKKKINQQD